MEHNFLVFGDLHGKILPAFQLAKAWSLAHGTRLDGILQVGDLGYFPDPANLDRATRQHAKKDPLELGARLVAEPSAEADQVFTGVSPILWFTAGNHEDFEELERRKQEPGATPSSFPVDAYGQVRCLRDGQVEELPGQLRVGAVWGIDGAAPRARHKVHPQARIRSRSATQLAGERFDVLLSHDSPRDAVFADSGSEELSALIQLARPRFAFFGHYGEFQGEIEWQSGGTRVFHMAGFELRGAGGCAEPGSVGRLAWSESQREFAYLDESWLRRFTRHNWQYW
jgi:hypothetical protein